MPTDEGDVERKGYLEDSTQNATRLRMSGDVVSSSSCPEINKQLTFNLRVLGNRDSERRFKSWQCA